MNVETYKGYGECGITLNELRRLARHGSPGECCVYFAGSALPRRPGSVWEIAYELYEAGYLSLVQRRVAHAEPPSVLGKFDYIAKRTAKPWAEPERAARTRMMMAS